MNGINYLILNNIIILPKNWYFDKSLKPNQPFFKYIKRKITPAEIQKIMQKKAWFAPPALLTGGATSPIFFENSTWLGWRDSNPRILVPETSALPLGHIPLTE